MWYKAGSDQSSPSDTTAFPPLSAILPTYCQINANFFDFHPTLLILFIPFTPSAYTSHGTSSFLRIMSAPSSDSGSSGDSGTQHPHNAGKTPQVEVHYPSLPSNKMVRKIGSHTSLVSVASRDQDTYVPMHYDEDWEPEPEERLNRTRRAQADNYDEKRGVVSGTVETGPTSRCRIVENYRNGVIIYQDRPSTSISIYPPGTDLGPAFGTDRSHTQTCQEKSRIVEYQGHCFCPLDPSALNSAQ